MTKPGICKVLASDKPSLRHRRSISESKLKFTEQWAKNSEDPYFRCRSNSDADKLSSDAERTCSVPRRESSSSENSGLTDDYDGDSGYISIQNYTGNKKVVNKNVDRMKITKDSSWLTLKEVCMGWLTEPETMIPDSRIKPAQG